MNTCNNIYTVVVYKEMVVDNEKIRIFVIIRPTYRKLHAVQRERERESASLIFAISYKNDSSRMTSSIVCRISHQTAFICLRECVYAYFYLHKL